MDSGICLKKLEWIEKTEIFVWSCWYILIKNIYSIIVLLTITTRWVEVIRDWYHATNDTGIERGKTSNGVSGKFQKFLLYIIISLRDIETLYVYVCVCAWLCVYVG